MQIGTVLLVLAVALAVGLFVAQPLRKGARRIKRGETQNVSALLAERERAINALQELDFDHQLGKVPADDYPAQRSALVQRGAEILRKLDALSPSPLIGKGMPNERGEGNADAKIESAIAARRAKINSTSLVDDDIEALISARRSKRKSKSGGFCPRCGKPVTATDRFCPNCGKAIT